MTPAILYLLCVLIGASSGLRTLTGLAIVALAAQTGWPHLHWLHLTATNLSFLSQPDALYTLLALSIGELVADKLPFLPARTKAAGLVARIAAGIFCAATLAEASGLSWVFPSSLGAIAALSAAFAGYWLRRSLTARGLKDFPVALAEDGVTVALAFFAVSRF